MSELAHQVLAWFGFLALLLTGLGISAYLDRAAQREEHERRKRMADDLRGDL